MQPRQPAPGLPQGRRKRLLGIALVGTATLGLMLSVAGLIFVYLASTAAESALTRELAALDRALTATSDGLTVADTSLSEARTTLSSLSTTLGSATSAITNTQPTLIALEDLTGQGIPETITSTRQALDSAEEAARSAELVLRALTFFGQRYEPEVPLDVAIGEVGNGLSSLTPSLSEVTQGLDRASNNLSTVTSDLSAVASGLEAIAASVSEATAVIDQYQTVVGDLQSELEAVRNGAPRWIAALRVGLTLLFIWLALAQMSPLAQGWALLAREESAPDDTP